MGRDSWISTLDITETVENLRLAMWFLLELLGEATSEQADKGDLALVEFIHVLLSHKEFRSKWRRE